jgi:hypothetical protein
MLLFHKKLGSKWNFYLKNLNQDKFWLFYDLVLPPKIGIFKIKSSLFFWLCIGTQSVILSISIWSFSHTQQKIISKKCNFGCQSCFCKSNFAACCFHKAYLTKSALFYLQSMGTQNGNFTHLLLIFNSTKEKKTFKIQTHFYLIL